MNDIRTAKPAVKEYSTHLTSRQNLEGLCYDKNNNRLLLAIKDREPGKSDYKGIYSFDLSARKIIIEPVFKINLRNDVFVNGSTKKKKAMEIMPSAIAIHPVTNHRYITGGIQFQLLGTDATGAIKKLYQLNRNEFAQPEGIAFKPNGEMFIWNEGPKKAGKILKGKIGAE